MNGETLSNTQNLPFNENELEKIRKSKRLKFVKSNKKSFGIDEHVSFMLEMKNIQNLTVKIFEINTFNYYKKTMKEVTSKVDLEGLIPAKSFLVQYNDNPILIIKRDIGIDYLNEQKRGVFIVEFIGGGLSSRVLIKKGSLTQIPQIIKDNAVFHIINESKMVCTEKTAIVIGNVIYKADKTGKILVPLEENKREAKVVLSCGDFSELAHVVIPAAKYF